MTTDHSPPEDPPAGEPSGPTLSPADAAALDALVEHGPSPRPTLTGLLAAEMPTPPLLDPARLARAQAWINLIKSAPAPAPSPDLLARTLAAVQQDRMKLPPRTPAAAPSAAAFPAAEPRAPHRWSRRLGEYAAMAIAASILVAVLVPGITTARQSAKRVACASNLGFVGQAFDSYSVNNAHELPALALPDDHNWLPQGPGLRPIEANRAGHHSNSANLLPLINASYMPAARLLCAGRNVPESTTIDLSASDIPENIRGYSYASLYGDLQPHWDGRHSTLILADRNPLFGAYVTDNVHANSFNHGGGGNYILRADGAVSWETSPDIGPDHDNIWTIGKQCQRLYKGTETVSLAGDVFLAP